MALTIAFIVSFIAVANAGYGWIDDSNEQGFNPFQHVRMPNMHFPNIPMPHFPRFPNHPQPPRFPFAGFQMPFIPLPKIPTPGEIANMKPGPNQVFNGVAVKSSSGFTRDKDGNLVKTGGTTILVNDNGEVEEKQTGNNPPNLNEPIVFPAMPVFKPFVMPPMPKPVFINPIDIENRQPNDNEHFVSTSTSTYSHSSDVNGVKSSGGGSSTVVNNNGEVEKEAVLFGDGDKQ